MSRTKTECLLFQTELTIKEIAIELGYKGPSYFTRLFTKAIGTSPTQFKANYRNSTLLPASCPLSAQILHCCFAQRINSSVRTEHKRCPFGYWKCRLYTDAHINFKENGK